MLGTPHPRRSSQPQTLAPPTSWRPQANHGYQTIPVAIDKTLRAESVDAKAWALSVLDGHGQIDVYLSNNIGKWRSRIMQQARNMLDPIKQEHERDESDIFLDQPGKHDLPVPH